MTVWIDIDLCNTCEACVTNCPYDAIESKNHEMHITSRCTECGSCMKTCNKEAICSDSNTKIIPNFDTYKGVWTFIEHGPEGIRNVSTEILSKARNLAEILKQKTTALVLGYEVSSSTRSLKDLGADEVLVVDDKKLKHYDAELYASIIRDIVKSRNPNIFLFGATHVGRDLAPRVAKLIGSGLTADCTDLTIDTEKDLLVQTRPAFGGNILATIVSQYSRPQMATVRPGVMVINQCQTKKTTKIEFLPCKIKQTATKVLETVKRGKIHVELSKAKIIVSGGRGMENAKGVEMLHRLASSLNGEVAGTRVAVENGWISEKNQVGQTGQTVRPDLYIACGISGAIQHRAGMMNSKFIIAINKDPYAAIFKAANWGIVGDVFKVLPELIKHVQTASKCAKLCQH